MDIEDNEAHLLDSRSDGQHLGKQVVAGRAVLTAAVEFVEHTLQATDLAFDATQAGASLLRKFNFCSD